MNSENPTYSPRTFNRVQIIRGIIEGYQGDIPFHRYLKNFYSANKSFGSNDRRIYRAWCYAWFRLGNALSNLEFTERLCWGYYLVNDPADELFLEISSQVIHEPMPDGPLGFRINHAGKSLGVLFTEDIFPSRFGLSDGITYSEWVESHLLQPFVFIRVRNKFTAQVSEELEAKGIVARPTTLSNAFSFAENTDLQSLDSFKNGLFEIQDLSSQMVCENLPVKIGASWWDCCSGSGGKSLLMADRFPETSILCSDIRPSIMENLNERVRKAQIKNITSRLMDASKEIPGPDLFDGVMVDAPCSGSGTWRRNPENLSFFDESMVSTYQGMQLSILQNVNRSLKKGGFLVYITCSVFRAENEDVIAIFTDNFDYQVLAQSVLAGFSNNSDCMFVTVLEKRI